MYRKTFNYLRGCGILRHGVDNELNAEGAGEAKCVGEQPEHSAGKDEFRVHGEARLQDPCVLHQTFHRLVLHLGLFVFWQGAQVFLLQRGAVPELDQGDHPTKGHPGQEGGLVVFVHLGQDSKCTLDCHFFFCQGKEHELQGGDGGWLLGWVDFDLSVPP